MCLKQTCSSGVISRCKSFYKVLKCFHFLSRSHLVTIPPGPSLAEALRTSPVVQGEDGYTPAGGFGSGFDDVDPNLDPELALVRKTLLLFFTSVLIYILSFMLSSIQL